VDVFFVCGAPKSGTTWLQRILDAHPQVCCSGEGHFIERFTIPAAKVVNAYNQRLEMESEQVYEGNPVYRPLDQAEFDEIARTFVLNRLLSRRPGPEVLWVGDKTPGYSKYLRQLHRLFPEARVIHIVRDPRDVAVSRMGHASRIGHREVFSPGSETHRATLEGAIKTWTEAVEGFDAFALAHPGLACEVSYQALHAEPLAAMAALFGFLGVDAGEARLSAIAAETSFEALTGRKPGEEDPSSFFRKGVTGDWRGHLDAEGARMFEQACGPLMRARGFL
jgi:LPS sulfotransferase NodH